MSLIQYLRSDVQSVAADADLLDGARRLEQTGAALIPVTESGGLVGMLSARDILVKAVVAERDPARLKVADVMSPPGRCQPQTPVEQVAEDLAMNGQPGVVVQDPVDGRIIGVVEIAALLRSRRQAQGPEPEYVKRVRGEGV